MTQLKKARGLRFGSGFIPEAYIKYTYTHILGQTYWINRASFVGVYLLLPGISEKVGNVSEYSHRNFCYTSTLVERLYSSI